MRLAVDKAGETMTELDEERHIVVRGGRRLTGEISVEGAKNSALKLIAASLMAPGTSRISNVPDISDVVTMGEVVSGLGASVERSELR